MGSVARREPELIVLDDDDDDDDEEHHGGGRHYVGHAAVATATTKMEHDHRGELERRMDDKTWALEAQTLSSKKQSSSSALKRLRARLGEVLLALAGKRPRKAARQEETDHQMALLLQKEEEENNKRSVRYQKATHQEETDRQMALLLQKEEEENSKRSGRNKCLTKEEVLQILLPCQRNAVEFVQGKAKPLHLSTLPVLEARVEKLGFTNEDLQHCLHYIKDQAPIIIHLKEPTLHLLIKDTHYRNLFETNTSSGSTNQKERETWESYMFGGSYSRSGGSGQRGKIEAFDRPKYGCLNVTGDIRGVPVAASQYGEIHIVLQNVRQRSTFFSEDTGAFVSTESLATNEFYSHVLNSYNDDELSSVLGVCGADATTASVGGAPSKCTQYKEVQIHGPVCLETDVQALSLPGCRKDASKELLKTVEAFQKMSDCNILWQGDIMNDDTR